MIRLLNLGPAEHEEVAIYVVNQRIPNVRELRELLCSGAIRGYQVRGKRLFDPNIIIISENSRTAVCQAAVRQKEIIKPSYGFVHIFIFSERESLWTLSFAVWKEKYPGSFPPGAFFILSLY